jgi:hypothetical protein
MGTLHTKGLRSIAVRLSWACLAKGLPADAWTYLTLAEFLRAAR